MDDRSGSKERALAAVRAATEGIGSDPSLTDEVMVSAEAEASVSDAKLGVILARLGQATARLDLDPAFADGLMSRLNDSASQARPSDVETDDEVLERLGQATAGLAPRAEFLDAVMTLVEAEQESEREAPVSSGRQKVLALFPEGMMRWARASLVAAGMAAAASIALSWYSESALDREVIAASDPLEAGE